MRIYQHIASLIFLLVFFVSVTQAVAQSKGDEQGKEELQKIEATNKGKVEDGVQSQKIISALDSETETLAREYQSALIQLQSLREYNAQMEKLIVAQKKEMADIRTQIEDVTTIDRTIIPHMFRMIEGLEKFVSLDVPFLKAEREGRVERLRALMDRSDANPAEKYRKILEAFEIENEYGRTIEVYEGEIEIDDEAHIVNFLRIGRVAWIYQTLDGSESAVWRQDKKEWESIGMDGEIRQAMRVAKEHAAPNLLILPLMGPTEIKQ